MFYRSGKYRKLSSETQQEPKNPPLEKPFKREKLKPAADHTRPATTWFKDQQQQKRTKHLYKKQISEDFSNLKYPQTNLAKTYLTASEPFLASRFNEQKEKSSRIHSKFFSFGIAKLRDKTAKRSANSVRTFYILIHTVL